ncbi:hypothetical protein Q0601_12575 [Paracoccus onubensis]|uniref:sulfotransferase family protein n=1 Tax=Paracoccus onubensis TaxID=1675788 RepID=UPI00272F7573|nr:hypothetical protein [Paracoccus onubensis]MDP0928012.1 hypothetical protein [Paracoccus onubensis]
MNKKTSDRTAVVVLGMHRSGTSALSGVLNILGCEGPATLMAPNESNEKGYFESGKFYRLHTELFASAGTHWDDWLPMPASWSASPPAREFHERAVKTMTDEFGQSRLFVLKDPRICRLVPFWEDVFHEVGATPGYVLTHRNPLEVAASLAKRNGITRGLSHLIWLRHILDAEANTRNRPRCFTSFTQLLTDWTGVAEKIQTALDLSLPRFSLGAATEVEAFLESDLQHHKEMPGKILQSPMLSTWVRDTYEILERWVSDGENSEDHKRLDALRGALDRAAPNFAQIIKSGLDKADTLTKEQATMTACIDDLRLDMAERDEQVKRLETQLEQTQSRVLELDEVHAALLAERQQDAAEIQRLNKEIERERAARSATEARSAEFDSRLQVQFRELSEVTRLLAESEKREQEGAALLSKAEARNDAEKAELQEVANQLRDEIAALHNSRSWRVTRPLRRFTDGIRSLRK